MGIVNASVGSAAAYSGHTRRMQRSMTVTMAIHATSPATMPPMFLIMI
jgi:hypothetical protein